jgi:general nucleoside transport system ATP-binding protein
MTPILSMRGIHKSFGGTRALDNVNFDLDHGEIHGLLGGNGAGKTSLMNVLYGLYRPDAGEVRLDEKPVSISAPRDAIRLGIGMVHQHFLQIDTFSVTENVVLGAPRASAFSLDLNGEGARIQALAQKFGVEVEPSAEISSVALGMRQKIEILKALYRGAKILILDEPTSNLTPQEVDSLFAFIQELVGEGMSVVFITHKIREVLNVCNRISVLRDGKNVETLVRRQAAEEELVRAMVGEGMDLRGSLIFSKDAQPPAREVGAAVVLQVRDLRVAGAHGVARVKNCSFEIREGEIFGIAGVGGNGQRDLVEAIMASRSIAQGGLALGGKEITGASTLQRLRAGIAYIPEDRLRDGFLPAADLARNLILGAHRDPPYLNGRWFDWKSIYQVSSRMIDEYHIQASGPTDIGGNLSGGNIQRVLIARALARQSRILVAHNPTHGLDIPSTEFVYRKLLERKKNMGATLLVSEDLDELLLLCDRIGVMFRGELVGVLGRNEFDKYQIGKWMAGVKN